MRICSSKCVTCFKLKRRLPSFLQSRTYISRANSNRSNTRVHGWSARRVPKLQSWFLFQILIWATYYSEQSRRFARGFFLKHILINRTIFQTCQDIESYQQCFDQYAICEQQNPGIGLRYLVRQICSSQDIFKQHRKCLINVKQSEQVSNLLHTYNLHQILGTDLFAWSRFESRVGLPVFDQDDRLCSKDSSRRVWWGELEIYGRDYKWLFAQLVAVRGMCAQCSNCCFGDWLQWTTTNSVSGVRVNGR